MVYPILEYLPPQGDLFALALRPFLQGKGHLIETEEVNVFDKPESELNSR